MFVTICKIIFNKLTLSSCPASIILRLSAIRVEVSFNDILWHWFAQTEQTKKVEIQTKLNTRNLIQQDTRIKKLEEQPRVQTVVQPAVVSEEIESLKSKVLDLQCRSMKNNLVFYRVFAVLPLFLQETAR
jgi:hypothetical protein